MDDKSKLVEVTIVFCFSRPHLIIISFLLFLYSVAVLERSFGTVTDSENNGVSPSGKAQDFESCITLVRIQPPQLCRCGGM